jgi:MFS family permease
MCDNLNTFIVTKARRLRSCVAVLSEERGFLIKRKRFPKIYFGWWQTLVTCTWGGLGSGFSTLGISVLFKPIATDLSLSRAAASLAAGVSRLEGGLVAPVTGWLSDKYGPKWVIFTGACIVVIGLVLMYFINSLWQYIVVWGAIIGSGSNLAFTLAIDKTITNWFIKKRGRAFATRFVLIGILGVILLPIVTWLVTTQGWRMANLIWAVVMFTGLPFLWFFVKRKRPEYYGLLPDGAPMTEEAADTSQMIDTGVEYATSLGETEFTIRQALKTPSYWLLALGFSAGTTAYGAINVHLISFLTDIGIDPGAAGGMMALMVFFNIPSTFLTGFFADRVRTDHLRFLLVGVFLLQVIGITVIILSQTIAMIYVFLILFGFGSGANIIVRILIEGRFFGRKAFASIHGVTNLLHAPIGFVTPIFAGWIYDTTGSYTIAFVSFATLTMAGACLVFFLRPPKPPAEVTDISKFM